MATPKAFAPPSPAVIAGLVVAGLFNCAVSPSAIAQSQYTPDPGCTLQEAWPVQTNPLTDPSGKNNIDFPLQQATYWGTGLTGSAGDSVIIQGQFPAARYMALQVYDYNRNVLGDLSDSAIDPDPGQNNPYRRGGGSAQGTYTVQLIFGQQPRNPPANTFYTNGEDSVILLYRVYYSDNPDDLTGGTVNPVLPTVTAAGVALQTCPPRPIIVPDTLTVWGRLDQIDFVGTEPSLQLPAFNPPQWHLSSTNAATQFFPNQDNSYMATILSRKFLTAPYNNNLVVIQMRAPSFTDTQNGVPPYADAEMRFWSMCTDEPLSTGVVRCIPDNLAAKVNGLVTFVISDPSYQPSASVLEKWGAEWIAWGALEPGDSVYDAQENLLTNANGVFYYNAVFYRQTVANPLFLQSIANVSNLPNQLAQTAMGEYAPQIGYCTAQGFENWGAGCIGRIGQ